MRAWRLGLALAAALPLAAAGAPLEDPPLQDEPLQDEPLQDERLDEAASLLGDASGFERAIELYREVLAEHPEATEARLALARVLAWSGRFDASIAEYDALLAAAERPAGARLERAEVLSWAKRYVEAEAELQAILEEDPENARAARALARVRSWSGRAAAADDAYRRALALEEDAEARREWTLLRANYPPSLEGRFSYREDNAGLRLLRSEAEGAWFFDLDTRLVARSAYLRVQADPGVATAGFRDADRGFEYVVGVHRQLSPVWRTELELGGRSWVHAGTRLLARGRIEAALDEETVAAFEVDHRDFLERSDSLFAVEDGIRDTSLGLSAWKQLTSWAEYWGRVEGSFLSDGNERVSVLSSLTFRPWPAYELRFDLSGGYLRYAATSDLYYDPSADWNVRAGASYRLQILEGLTLHLAAGVGYGRARQDGRTGKGGAYDVSGALAWKRGPFRLRVGGGRSQARRGSAYVVNRATGSVGWDF